MLVIINSWNVCLKLTSNNTAQAYLFVTWIFEEKFVISSFPMYITKYLGSFFFYLDQKFKDLTE